MQRHKGVTHTEPLLGVNPPHGSWKRSASQRTFLQPGPRAEKNSGRLESDSPSGPTKETVDCSTNTPVGSKGYRVFTGIRVSGVFEKVRFGISKVVGFTARGKRPERDERESVLSGETPPV